jgi:hypothetical protein
VSMILTFTPALVKQTKEGVEKQVLN